MTETNTPLNAKLARAIASVKAAERDRTNPMFKSPYSTIASVIRVVKPACHAQGFAIMQTTSFVDNGTRVNTYAIDDASGEEKLISETVVPMVKLDAHAMGGATTYGRRFSLQAIFGLEAEDNDGNDTLPEAKVGKPDAKPIEGAKSAHGEDEETPEFMRGSYEDHKGPGPFGKPLTPARPPEKPAARPAVTSEGTTVGQSSISKIYVKEGVGAKGPWKRFDIHFTDGTKANTFNSEAGALAQDALQKGLKCAYDIRPNSNPKWAGDLVDFVPVYPAGDGDLDND